MILSPPEYSKIHDDIVCLVLTSRDQGDEGLALSLWRESGLVEPTWIKPVIGTISAGLVERRLGKRGIADYPLVSKAIGLLIDSWLLGNATCG